MRKTGMGLATLGVALVAAACGGKGEKAGGSGGEAKLEVSADPSALAFHETALKAAPGQAIVVEFKNPSQLPHTWVLVAPGDEEKVDQSAQPTGAVDGVAGVIKASGVVNGGSSETIQVGALEPGTYSFICTFPGHLAAGMKGTLTVQ